MLSIFVGDFMLCTAYETESLSSLFKSIYYIPEKALISSFQVHFWNWFDFASVGQSYFQVVFLDRTVWFPDHQFVCQAVFQVLLMLTYNLKNDYGVK